MNAIAGTFIFVCFFLLVWLMFGGLLDTTTGQTNSIKESAELQEERLSTLVSITPTSTSACDYIATVHNRSDGVSFDDFSQIDVFARYTDTTGDITTNHLAYPSEWSVVSISGDNTNPDIWDPDETAIISFALQPQAQVGTKGTIALSVPGGVSDSAYFDAPPCFYLHNDPTPPTGDTVSQSLLPMDDIKPSATTLYNYDTNRDTAAGLVILKGATGEGETDPLKYQVWRATPQVSDLVISGDVSIAFWSATKNFQIQTGGAVTVFLRDRYGTGDSDYTSIDSGTVVDPDWQGASGTFVRKTITMPAVNYTVVASNELEAKLIVPTTSSGDMWFAFDTTSYLSAIQLP